MVSFNGSQVDFSVDSDEKVNRGVSTKLTLQEHNILEELANKEANGSYSAMLRKAFNGYVEHIGKDGDVIARYHSIKRKVEIRFSVRMQILGDAVNLLTDYDAEREQSSRDYANEYGLTWPPDSKDDLLRIYQTCGADVLKAYCEAYSVTGCDEIVTAHTMPLRVSFDTRLEAWMRDNFGDGQSHKTSEIRNLAEQAGIIENASDWDKIRQIASRSGWTSGTPHGEWKVPF